MNDTKRLPSSVFRVTYPALEEPVAVTVLGRVIGRWVPVTEPHEAPKATEPTTSSASPAGVVDSPNPVPGMTQAARDAVLRRVAKGGKA